MNWKNIAFDWNQARAFLATAEEGSLLAASRALGLTQPTVGRQVAALEEELGVVLFDRIGRSLKLTPNGLDLLEHFRAMGEAASRISLAASGQAQSIEGHVAITVTDLASVYIMPAALAEIRKQAPDLEIELVVSNELRDLHRREADIAIRNVPPEQQNLIAKRVRTSPARLYGATRYLDDVGRPARLDDLGDLAFIGYDEPDRMIEAMAEHGLHVRRDQFRIFASSGLAIWEFVRQGLGLSMMLEEVADVTPEVELVLPELAVVPVDTWLVTHSELRTSRRIRLIYDILAEVLARKTLRQPIYENA